MKTSCIRVLVWLAAVGGLSGCALVLNGTKQQITVSSNPPGATVKINRQVVGVTPLTAKVARGKEHTVQLEHPLYPDSVRTYQLKPTLAGKYFALDWGVPAAVTGAAILADNSDPQNSRNIDAMGWLLITTVIAFVPMLIDAVGPSFRFKQPHINTDFSSSRLTREDSLYKAALQSRPTWEIEADKRRARQDSALLVQKNERQEKQKQRQERYEKVYESGKMRNIVSVNLLPLGALLVPMTIDDRRYLSGQYQLGYEYFFGKQRSIEIIAGFKPMYTPLENGYSTISATNPYDEIMLMSASRSYFGSVSYKHYPKGKFYMGIGLLYRKAWYARQTTYWGPDTYKLGYDRHICTNDATVHDLGCRLSVGWRLFTPVGRSASLHTEPFFQITPFYRMARLYYYDLRIDSGGRHEQLKQNESATDHTIGGIFSFGLKMGLCF